MFFGTILGLHIFFGFFCEISTRIHSILSIVKENVGGMVVERVWTYA